MILYYLSLNNVLIVRFLRMSPERFEHLLSLVGPLIQKEDTRFRRSISPEERLAVTLRFLATGDAQQSLSFSFRIGKSTLSKVISETCQMIYECLKDKFLQPPETESDWGKIARSFEELWNMPNVIGSIDGKHIRIQCPKLSGTQFYNYKGFFSIVLLAVCDANYCFTLFDLGQYGSNNDSGILSNSVMGDLLENGKLRIPKSRIINENVGALPYYLHTILLPYYLKYFLKKHGSCDLTLDFSQKKRRKFIIIGIVEQDV